MSHQPVITMDWTATFLELAGADRLYDLEADAREQAHLARSRPADLDALRTAWEAVDSELLPY